MNVNYYFAKHRQGSQGVTVSCCVIGIIQSREDVLVMTAVKTIVVIPDDSHRPQKGISGEAREEYTIGVQRSMGDGDKEELLSKTKEVVCNRSVIV